MEEKKRKLSYEELEAYANQTVNTAKNLYEENKKLKKMLEDTRVQMNYADIDFAFKALDHKEFFSKDFIKKVVDRLELILTPSDIEEPVEEEKEDLKLKPKTSKKNKETSEKK